MSRQVEIRELYRQRPRSRFLRWSSAALAVLAIASWFSGELGTDDLFSARRLANLERFVGELVPYPLQGEAFDAGVAFRWARDLMAEKGWAAAGKTLALSVAAIVLAAFGALVLAPAAARTFASPEPYLPGPRPPGPLRRTSWKAVVWGGRALLILFRSMPEYVLAFLLLAMLGPTAWPVVLALAIHNSGILGKLTAEIVENLDPKPMAALRGLGARRPQIVVFGLYPLVFPRFLLFFFYRWETCVREATVLGMLGVVSLGYWIVDARARNHYDEMFALILVGAAIVVLGDLVSILTRELVRRFG